MAVLLTWPAAVTAADRSDSAKADVDHRSPGPRIIDARTAFELSANEAAAKLAEADVVFLGENHDSAAGHWMQLELIRAMHRQRPDLVISLEMFERDVQGTLGDYLRGQIDERRFLALSRPWSNYEEHYRPVVEFAREQRLDVIAANIPRRIASAVAKNEEIDPEDQPYLPRETTAPEDAYAARFRAVMQGHGGSLDEEKLQRYYRSQCLKDDCMAESIAGAFAARRDRWPLVVHLCGRFHSDLGYGTVQRLQARMPLLKIAVVSMEEVDAAQLPTFDPRSEDLDEARRRCHVLILVPEEPSAEAAREPVIAPRPAGESASISG